MNKVEAWKAEKHGFDVWPDLERYAAAGTAMAEIAEADLERLKWYGLFYRKRVEDGRYMIRIRLPGCELTAAQARAVAAVARLGFSIIDVTTRGNVQVQGFHISDLPGVVARLQAVGLTSKQTGHDNVRNVMCHPWAGLDPEELIDARPLCRRLTDVFLGDRLLSDLPRKFNVAVDSRPVPALHCWTQDTSFIAARHPGDGSIVFHWLLAGTQGQNPRLAWKLPVWVREEQAPEVLRQALLVFRAEGSREKRDKARLRYLIERIGEIGFLERVEARLGYRLERSEAVIPGVERHEDFIGWFAQKQPGLWALGVSVPLGRLTHEQLDGLADLAETCGGGCLRTAYDQGIVIPNIPAHLKGRAVRALNRIGLEHEADSITRNVVACTGRQFCNIAVSETKGHAFTLMERLRAQGVRLAGIKINMSGCPSSCAQTYTADIGLKGVRVRRKAGTCDGFDVFVGGGVHGAVELGLLYRKGVDVDQLPEVIADLVRTYDREHNGDQTFSQFWRDRIAAGHTASPVAEEEFRPDIWVCEQCGHQHAGDDPPIFCPRCAALRKSFARMLDEPSLPAEAHQAPVAPARTDGYRDVASLEELRRNGRLAVQIDGHELALFLVGNEIRCLDGLCPHEGGPMAQGDVADGIVSCPWHGWAFRTSDGAAADGNGCRLRTYPTKVEAGRILVAWGAAAPARATTRKEQPELALKVIEVVEETHDTRTIRLDNTEGRFATHRAGQHLKVCVPGPSGPTWRSFTVSSPPTRPQVIEVTVKQNPDGVVSKALHTLQAGDTVIVTGPSGRFVFDPEAHREPLVLAVAGSGVTPAMSILRTIQDRQLDLPVTLLYGCRTEADIIFGRELEQLRLRLARLRLVITLSRPGPGWTGPVGRVSPELLARHVPEPMAARYYICGPGDMRETLSTWLAAQGVPADRIHFEVFGKARKAAALPVLV
ncbi:MAG: Rieske 2Fe-2S domain-containing protein [Isosphaeraceae bacterium]|nr:Rieske 2Fe-2S domain-containing protein [Isosphaeraceae bacterium]